ncbi:hypothetical protein FGU71_13025 [Erythrobacter insulae]|uniref:Uncharacterized protein n=1 Tax=Erythrobacter insulae TaxID=2584124 RepID=A0A547P701_9SPHN|nr:hypothetical protein [Erythrobacter insulae]TRD09922.1 hypothetical protein FGU71_13025 [Erythrobacter insulae]
MKRTDFLIMAALVLLIGHAVGLASGETSSHQLQTKRWVAFHPDLERHQRQNPHHLLSSSHHVDGRYDVFDEIDFRHKKFVDAAVSCGVKSWKLMSYVQPVSVDQISTEVPSQMPDRLFLGTLSGPQIKCVNGKLPDGYELVRLAQPVDPSPEFWLTDLSTLVVQESANAQTH